MCHRHLKDLEKDHRGASVAPLEEEDRLEDLEEDYRLEDLEEEDRHRPLEEED